MSTGVCPYDERPVCRRHEALSVSSRHPQSIDSSPGEMATQAGYTSLGVMSWSADDPRLDSCVQHDVKELWLPPLISFPVSRSF